ncbi:MAG: hypothetical protein IJM34_12095 [Lachnospiraceae bacterium]|nr:hypothetical protein [Lachnospiraceae bacterium]
MKKKMITLVIALSMATMISGCGNQSVENAGTTDIENVQDVDIGNGGPEETETVAEATPTEDPAVIAQREEEKQAKLDEQYGADYEKAVKLFEDGSYKEARDLFKTMKDYKESTDYIGRIGSAIYDEMEQKYNASDIDSAKELASLIDESSEWTGYNKTLTLLDEIESKRIREEGYTKDELPNGYFIKKGDHFFPFEYVEEMGFTYDILNDVIYIDADKYSDDLFMRMSSTDTIVYKGSDKNMEHLMLYRIDQHGYTYEVALDDYRGAYSIRDKKTVIDAKIADVNDISYHEWWSNNCGYYGDGVHLFDHYDVFLNNNDIPKGDKIKIGYYTDTSEYREKEFVADLWLAYIGTHSFSGNYYFEPTKEGYFTTGFSEGREKSGLYAITLGPNGKAVYVWIN